jgi:hypothetical protein
MSPKRSLSSAQRVVLCISTPLRSLRIRPASRRILKCWERVASGQGTVVDLAEVGTIQGTFRSAHFREDLGAHGIGQGVEKPLDSNVAHYGMEKRPHKSSITWT